MVLRDRNSRLRASHLGLEYVQLHLELPVFALLRCWELSHVCVPDDVFAKIRMIDMHIVVERQASKHCPHRSDPHHSPDMAGVFTVDDLVLVPQYWFSLDRLAIGLRCF